MSENPLQGIFQAVEKISQCVQTHLSQFIGQPHKPLLPKDDKPLFSVSSSSILHPSNSLSQPNKFYYLCYSFLTWHFCERWDTELMICYFCHLSGNLAGPVTKEELGRSTWTFLHTLAAQYPENPTRQQKKNVKEPMAILSRMYPCKECADHFKGVLSANPVQAGSQAEFAQWLCHVHNVLNRSLGKLIFHCERVDARWGKLDCEQRACDLQGATDFGQGIPK